MRRRVQSWIDRRFYRRRYDAEQVLTTFSAMMCNEVALEKLTGKLVETVHETMQPAQVSIWLQTEKIQKS